MGEGQVRRAFRARKTHAFSCVRAMEEAGRVWRGRWEEGLNIDGAAPYLLHHALQPSYWNVFESLWVSHASTLYQLLHSVVALVQSNFIDDIWSFIYYDEDEIDVSRKMRSEVLPAAYLELVWKISFPTSNKRVTSRLHLPKTWPLWERLCHCRHNQTRLFWDNNRLQWPLPSLDLFLLPINRG